MDYNKLNRLAAQHKRNGLRMGQSLMNALWELYPQIYSEITGTESDPFYNDKLIENFYYWLERNYPENNRHA